MSVLLATAMDEEPQVEVPCYFLCPISLCLMRDPVTLPTGITYDRDGIERWLLTGASTCPLTKQPVPSGCHPTPNLTLRRLIQSWCAAHPTFAADLDGRVNDHHTPARAADADVAAIVSRVRAAAAAASSSTGSSSPPQQELLAALRELRDAAADSDRNRKLVAAVPGAVELLAAVFSNSNAAAAAVRDEALEVLLSSLQLQQEVPEESLRRAAEANECALVHALVAALQQRSSPSRARAAVVLDRVTAALPPNRLASLPEQLFRETVELLRDRDEAASSSATTTTTTPTKAALHVLVRTAACGRNRVKAVEAGAVGVLVDMLFDGDDEPGRRRRRRVCELVLAALDRVCGCAEGRAELVAHAGGVAAVARMMRGSSELVATEKAVRVLRSVARHAATPAVVQEMARCGAVAALCVVARSDPEVYGGERTRERARETLRMHAGAWRNSPCLHHHLKAVYPC